MAHGINEGPVLFAYDGSDYAKAAIAEAGRQLEPGRPAIVLTIARDLGEVPALAFPTAAPPPDFDEYSHRRARDTADEGVLLALAAGFDAMPLVGDGVPVWQRIVATADDLNASLIVLGSHGRTGIGRLIEGSVSESTAAHTERDVLIVHRPEEPDGPDHRATAA